MPAIDEQTAAFADKLYEEFGKPLEESHRGEFAAIFPDGRIVLAPTLRETIEKAVATYGKGSFVFKIGEKTVGNRR